MDILRHCLEFKQIIKLNGLKARKIQTFQMNSE